MSSSLNHLGCAYVLQEQKSKVSLKTGLNIITGYYRCPHYKERKDFKGCKARLIINAEIVLSKEHNSTNEDEIVRSFLVKKEHTCAKSHIPIPGKLFDEKTEMKKFVEEMALNQVSERAESIAEKVMTNFNRKNAGYNIKFYS